MLAVLKRSPWPSDSDPACYGKVQVQIKSVAVMDDYLMRVLNISVVCIFILEIILNGTISCNKIKRQTLIVQICDLLLNVKTYFEFFESYMI